MHLRETSNMHQPIKLNARRQHFKRHLSGGSNLKTLGCKSPERTSHVLMKHEESAVKIEIKTPTTRYSVSWMSHVVEF